MSQKKYFPETELFFTHGIEIENHLVSKATGEVLVGNDLLITWEEMFNKAAEYLAKLKKDKKIPSYIAKKIVKIEVKEEVKREKRLSFVFIHYRLGKKVIPINCFGPDPNIPQLTWILELVTPPCNFLEELSFWIDTLYSAALYGLSKSDVALLPMGLNPMEKRVRSGLTCGEHHHIGVPSYFRAPVYNLIRNYVPHLIALSASSPFLDQSPSRPVMIKESNGREQIIGRCIHSYRLLNNTGQMGPNIPEYLPPIDEMTEAEDFARLVRKTPPDHRMVDIFPFTDYSTIEIRFLDAQPWSENRLALVLLIQAIAQKAKELASQKIPIANVNSQILYENRLKAVQFGLLAQFTPDPSLPPEFSKYYNFDKTTGKLVTKLYQSVKSLIEYVQNELETLGTNYLDYLLIPVLGTKKITPPISVADYLLLQHNNIKSFEKILPTLYYDAKSHYPLQLDGDKTFLEFVDIKEEDLVISTESSLNTKLRNDLLKKRISTKIVEKPKRKATPRKRKPPVKEREVVKPKKTVKKPPTEPPKTKTEKQEILVTPSKKPEPIVMEQELPPTNVISAFDESDDLEVYAPAIEVEPKYQKIESKIAKAMRTRRKEIEKKRKLFISKHLEEDRKDFNPFPKMKTSFPTSVSNGEVFGHLEFTFSDNKKAMYKFRKNQITIIFTASNKKKIETKLNTLIDTSILLKRKTIKIPCSFELGKLIGQINISVMAITATNERLIEEGTSFVIERKETVHIEPSEFYITGNYGHVECIFRGKNTHTKSEKGELLVKIVSQSLTESHTIHQSKFNLQPGEFVEFAQTVDLDINLQNSPFYIVSEIKTRRGGKSVRFKSIRVPILENIIVDWNYTTPSDEPNNLRFGVLPKVKYEVSFVFQILKPLPPVTMEVFLTSFPTGERKSLTELRVRREIDEGDELAVSNIQFKTPKKCDYLIFDLNVSTSKGPILLDLLGEPIGILPVGEQSDTTFEDRMDLKL